jgi:rhamnulokinase
VNYDERQVGMGTYYLAVDIGASSGRHILGHVVDNRIRIEEIYRFSNGLEKRNGHLCWNYDYLFQEIKNGLIRCKELGKIPVSMGIDTWAVDFVLLDEKDHVIGDTVGYRDSRTLGMDEKLYKQISEVELYKITGIQKQPFNTIYQLYAIKEQNPKELSSAKTLLMVPDYFYFMLTGEKVSEYTNATTTQLVAAGERTWDYELITRLGYPKDIFMPILSPGTLVGELQRKVVEEVGFNLNVVLGATHDTGSAVMAVPAKEENPLYISSGTWSLMGTEQDSAICNEESRRLNFTNEGGYGYRYRYLKNIMGLWMIQCVKSELNDEYSFSQLCNMADENSAFPSRVDVNHPDFLAPESMISAITTYCRDTKQQEPKTPGQVSACIYLSLAKCYGRTVKEIEKLTGRTYPAIYIIGGGSNAKYLSQLTATYTGKAVFAGPSEATAIGNLAAQMLYAREFKSIKEVRQCIYDSFEVKRYEP